MKLIIYDKIDVEISSTRDFVYSHIHMGEKTLLATVYNPVKIDFAVGDYVTFRSENFTLDYIPTGKKTSYSGTKGDALRYDLVFKSLKNELIRCLMKDVYLGAVDSNTHYTGLVKFSFFNNAQELGDRIQANLDRLYTGGSAWTVDVNPANLGDEMNIVFDKTNVWNALVKANTDYKLDFVITGRVITIGYTSVSTGKSFTYGKNNGLVDITRTTVNGDEIVTRLTAYGSDRNLPYDYAKRSNDQKRVEYSADGSTDWHSEYLTADLYIRISSDYGGSWSVASLISLYLFNVTDDASKPDYDDVGWRAEPYNVSSDKWLWRITSPVLPPPSYFPSSILADVADGRYIPALMLPVYRESGVDYIDSGNLAALGIRENSVTFDDVYPSIEEVDLGAGRIDEVLVFVEQADTFDIWVRDLGFNINNYLTSETALISMKTGYLAGYEFEIISVVEDTSEAGSQYRIRCAKNVNDANIILPLSPTVIVAGNYFVLLHIYMPESYITNAETALLARAQSYLGENDSFKASYTCTVDEIKMEVSGWGASLEAGKTVNIVDSDLGVNADMIIQKLSIEYNESPLPVYAFDLADQVIATMLSNMRDEIGSQSETTTVNKRVDTIDFRRGIFRLNELRKRFMDPNNYFNDPLVSAQQISAGLLTVGDPAQNFKITSLGLFVTTGSAQLSCPVAVLSHFEGEYKRPDGAQDWNIAATTFTGTTITDDEIAYYLYAKVSETAIDGEWILSDSQYPVDQFAGYYTLWTGILYTVKSGERDFDTTFGTSVMQGNKLITGKVRSIDGRMIIDLDSRFIDINGLVGMTSQPLGVSHAATDVRIWAGDSYANRNIAPFRVLQNGNVIANQLKIDKNYEEGYTAEIIDGTPVTLYLTEDDFNIIVEVVDPSVVAPYLPIVLLPETPHDGKVIGIIVNDSRTFKTEDCAVQPQGSDILDISILMSTVSQITYLRNGFLCKFIYQSGTWRAIGSIADGLFRSLQLHSSILTSFKIQPAVRSFVGEVSATAASNQWVKLEPSISMGQTTFIHNAKDSVFDIRVSDENTNRLTYKTIGSGSTAMYISAPLDKTGLSSTYYWQYVNDLF